MEWMGREGKKRKKEGIRKREKESAKSTFLKRQVLCFLLLGGKHPMAEVPGAVEGTENLGNQE